MAKLRIVQVPYNTPYVQNLDRYSDFVSVNRDDPQISKFIRPKDFIEKRDDPAWWGHFDIVHFQFGLEFEEIATLCEAITLIKERGKRVGITIHEIDSVHRTNASLRVILERISPEMDFLITLTNQAASELCHLIPKLKGRLAVIPHGPIALGELVKSPSLATAPSIALFGGLRENRESHLTLINATLSAQTHNARFQWITKPLSQTNLSHELLATLSLINSSHHAQIEMRSSYDDCSLYSQMQTSQGLLLPYKHAGHSGQIELALDLGIVPVFSDVGFLRYQIIENSDIPSPPFICFDWHDGIEWQYSSRLVLAIEKFFQEHRSLTVAMARWHMQYRASRLALHREIANLHKRIYQN